MWSPGLGTVIGLTMMLVGLNVLVIVAIAVFCRYRGVKRLHCPETGGWAAEIIENLEVTKACLRAAEADAAVDQWGVMCPAEMPLMVARQLFIRMYPRMAEMLHLLGSSSLMALPTEADLNGPLGPEITRYLETDTASAKERVRLFRLAWDTCCSAFASRQVFYERFFQGDRFRNVVLLNEVYDKAPMTAWVRAFLEQA